MTDSGRSPTADELLERREALLDAGREVTVEDLCRDAPPAVRAEVERRLAFVMAAEAALEPTCHSLWSTQDPPDVVGPDARFVPLGHAGRYESPVVQAQGGMGVLCLATDVEVNRKVAYKVIKPGHARQPEAVRRFFHEAEVTARLAHPGIVPVFGKVVDGTGLPAYASEYVSGHTLAAAVERFRAIDQADRPARDRARAALLRSFTDVCQIVAYAHSEGVVHGDLKPLNIMIDGFNATRLVDWGVSRVVGDGSDASDDPEPRPGTLYFMSTPFRAPSFSSDVYALGLTLALLLADGDAGRREDLRPAPGTPPALWAIAAKATNRDRAARYASAADLGREVREALDDRPVSAYPDPPVVKLRRFARGHKSAVAAGVALLVVAAVVGPGFAARERLHRQRSDAQRLRVVGLTNEVVDQAELVGKFQATLPDSRALLGRTARLIEQMARDSEAEATDLDAVAANYYRAGRIYQNLNQLDDADANFARAVLFARRSAAASDTAANRLLWADALRDRGVVLLALGGADEAALAWTRALEIVEPVAEGSARGRWTLARIQMALGNLSMQDGDQKSARAAFARALALLGPIVVAEPGNTRFLKALADVHSNQGFSLQIEAMPRGFQVAVPALLIESAADHRKALELRRRLARLEPGKPETLSDIASSLNHLANVSQAAGGPGLAEAEPLYREARVTLEALVLAYPGVPSNRRQLAEVYSNLNVLLARQRRREEAAALAGLSAQIFERLVTDYPNTPEYHTDLGVVLEQAATTLRLVGKPETADDRLYDSARAFARAYNLMGDGKRKDEFARRAVTSLATLQDSGYFRSPPRAAALGLEPAFDRLRDRDGFPRPTGGAGPPRRD